MRTRLNVQNRSFPERAQQVLISLYPTTPQCSFFFNVSVWKWSLWFREQELTACKISRETNEANWWGTCRKTARPPWNAESGFHALPKRLHPPDSWRPELLLLQLYNQRLILYTWGAPFPAANQLLFSVNVLLTCWTTGSHTPISGQNGRFGVF